MTVLNALEIGGEEADAAAAVAVPVAAACAA